MEVSKVSPERSLGSLLTQVVCRLCRRLTARTTADFSGCSRSCRLISDRLQFSRRFARTELFPAGSLPTIRHLPHIHRATPACSNSYRQRLREASERPIWPKGKADYKDVLKDRERMYSEGWIARPSPVAGKTTATVAAPSSCVTSPKLRQSARETLKRVGRIPASLGRDRTARRHGTIMPNEAVSDASQRHGGRPSTIRRTQSMYSVARSSYQRPEYHRPMQPHASPA